MDWVNTIVQGALIGGLYALFAAGLSLMFWAHHAIPCPDPGTGLPLLRKCPAA